MHLVRASLTDADDMDLVEISGAPHGTITNPPLYDPDRRIVVAFDSGNNVLRGCRFHGPGEYEPRWQHEFGTASHMIRFPDTGELVVNDFDETRGDDVVILDIETGAELGRAATGSFLQSVVFPAPGWNRDLYYCSFATVAHLTAGVVDRTVAPGPRGDHRAGGLQADTTAARALQCAFMLVRKLGGIDGRLACDPGPLPTSHPRCRSNGGGGSDARDRTGARIGGICLLRSRQVPFPGTEPEKHRE